MKYKIVREHTQYVYVEAKSEEEALAIVNDIDFDSWEDGEITLDPEIYLVN